MKKKDPDKNDSSKKNPGKTEALKKDIQQIHTKADKKSRK